MGARPGGVAEGWAPPRGRRDEHTGTWHYTLASRPDAGWSSERERIVARRYADLIGWLVDARYAAAMSVREVGQISGLSIATVTGIENGSSWPRLATVQAMAGAVGRRFTVRGDPDVVGALDALLVLARRTSRSATTYASVAELASLQPNTVARLTSTASPSMATVLAVSSVLNVPVILTVPVMTPPDS